MIKVSAGPRAHLEVWLEKNQPWKSLTLLAGFIFLWKSGWLASSRLAGIRMTLLRVIQIEVHINNEGSDSPSPLPYDIT